MIEYFKRIPTVVVVLLLFITLVAVGMAIGRTVDSSEADAPELMPISDVVAMLENDGMNVLLVNSRENHFPVVLESIEITFQTDNPVPTEDRVEGIINTFETLDNRAAWLETSRSLDGIAVVRGDELWAVSVDSDLHNSREIAERLAATLQGEVR